MCIEGVLNCRWDRGWFVSYISTSILLFTLSHVQVPVFVPCGFYKVQDYISRVNGGGGCGLFPM